MYKFRTKKGHEITIDASNEYLTKWAWQLNSVGYARRTVYSKETKRLKTLLMHRLIMDAKPNEIVDHINRNKLDNRIGNLRICTQSENLGNRHKFRANKTSKYLGVSVQIDKRWSTKKPYWRGSIIRNGKKYTKTFLTEAEAVAYRDAKAMELDGKYAVLNTDV